MVGQPRIIVNRHGAKEGIVRPHGKRLAGVTSEVRAEAQAESANWLDHVERESSSSGSREVSPGDVDEDAAFCVAKMRRSVVRFVSAVSVSFPRFRKSNCEKTS